MATDKNVNNKSAGIEESSPAGRRRRSPEAARENILAAAEAILTASGPQDLKLTEVARRAGVSAAAVLHHFASINGVQAALMERMVTNLVARIVAITATTPDHILSEEADTALFDAFEAQGAARLAAWLVMTGEAARLSVVRRAVDQVVQLMLDHLPLIHPGMQAGVAPAPPPRAVIEDMILASITAALGAGLFGAPLSTLLGRPPGSARQAIMAALDTHWQKAETGMAIGTAS